MASALLERLSDRAFRRADVRSPQSARLNLSVE
jgi:hypothetical protein